MFKYDVEISIPINDTDVSYHVLLFDYKSPVQHCKGDILCLGDQSTIVSSVDWVFEAPGEGSLCVETDFTVSTVEEAVDWLSGFLDLDPATRTARLPE